MGVAAAGRSGSRGAATSRRLSRAVCRSTSQRGRDGQHADRKPIAAASRNNAGRARFRNQVPRTNCNSASDNLCPSSAASRVVCPPIG